MKNKKVDQYRPTEEPEVQPLPAEPTQAEGREGLALVKQLTGRFPVFPPDAAALRGQADVVVAAAAWMVMSFLAEAATAYRIVKGSMDLNGFFRFVTQRSAPKSINTTADYFKNLMLLDGGRQLAEAFRASPALEELARLIPAERGGMKLKPFLS